MNTGELLTRLGTALAESPALLAWSQEKYGKDHTVYIGTNDEQPAPASEYPVIALTDVAEIHGNSAGMRTWNLGIGCGIINEDLTDGGRLKTYEGMTDAEQLRELVEGVLKQERFCKVTFGGETAPLNIYPIFVSYTVATIEVIHTRRRQ